MEPLLESNLTATLLKDALFCKIPYFSCSNFHPLLTCAAADLPASEVLMPHLPPDVDTPPLEGLERVHQGKVRDTYALPDHPDLRLVVATDRVSAFDFVLPTLMTDKGAVLTALNVFWRRRVLHGCPSDLHAWGAAIDTYLPGRLRGNPHLQARAVIVERLEMLDAEMIFRGNLTGSGLAAYHKTGEVCGNPLPRGLLDGDLLEPPIFTPSTKANEGHDEHVTEESIRALYGPRPKEFGLAIFQALRTYAASRGVIIADTKMEFGRHEGVPLLFLGDEVGTPDSSRFWLKSEWDARELGIPPQSYDKQIVRRWCLEMGFDKLDPKKPADRDRVHSTIVPSDIIEATRAKYHEIFSLLTGQTLREFQSDMMKIAA